MHPRRKNSALKRIPGFFFLLLLSTQAGVMAQFTASEPASFRAYLAARENESNDDRPVYYADLPQDTTEWQNPTAALFKSLLVPGLGQIGNKKYIKAGIVIALETTLIGAVVHYSRKTNDAREAFENPADSSLIPSLFNEYDDIKNTRNVYSWLLGITVFYSMFDAYVDAHLAHFPKKPKNISLEMESDTEGRPIVRLTCRF